MIRSLFVLLPLGKWFENNVRKANVVQEEAQMQYYYKEKRERPT